MSNQQLNQHAGFCEHSGVQDPVKIDIRKLLCGMPPVTLERSIFKVCRPLREVNEKAYDPEILAIGPYHHGNDKYKFLEEQKLRYLQRLLERRNEGSIDSCISELRKLEQGARNCYAETIDASQENFFVMMLIDGCFIIELFRKYMNGLRDKNDPIMHESGIRTSISKLYDLTKGPDEHHEFSYVAIEYFDIELGGPIRKRTIDKSQGEHLLHLYHMWCTFVLPKTPHQYYITVLPSATELRESGVRFRALQGGELSDIKFENGTLEIPVLLVEDNTESQFRNLIAYEQYRLSRGINYFTDYVKFLDCLINSSKDVKVLRRAGIIKNYLGDDEVVAQMFNKIGDYIIVSSSFYSKIFKNVDAYCKKLWNNQMATLRREYYHSPWAFLSVLVAIVLLLLTAVQTKTKTVQMASAVRRTESPAVLYGRRKSLLAGPSLFRLQQLCSAFSSVSLHFRPNHHPSQPQVVPPRPPGAVGRWPATRRSSGQPVFLRSATFLLCSAVSRVAEGFRGCCCCVEPGITLDRRGRGPRVWGSSPPPRPCRRPA
ncbi:hypothetical protein BT93_H1331 [Corymbia citriodora subsp. variegata]|nr:hypothetical protein BT93_H1331 [Corymbia citriodora subsp. variegata]